MPRSPARLLPRRPPGQVPAPRLPVLLRLLRQPPLPSKLPIVTLISSHLISKLEPKSSAEPQKQVKQTCCVGFHNLKSVSHIVKLPAAQASELIHRRCGGVPTAPKSFPVQDASTRSVRASVRGDTQRSIDDQIQRERDLAAKRAARQAAVKSSIPETVPEVPDHTGDSSDDAPYVSFTGTPSKGWGDPDEMEATVAELVYESRADSVTPDRRNMTGWLDFTCVR